MSITDLLDLVAIALFLVGLVLGLWVLFGPWSLCWGAVFVGAVSYVISKRSDG